ncbi:MAG: hypothetical protein QUV07_08905 [Cyanobium sp. CZS 25K]|nr:hypothetical protein [Cyanobium sp. CZS25K]
MDHVQTVRPLPRSGVHHGTSSAVTTPGTLLSSGSPGKAADALGPDAGEAEPSGDPDSPGPTAPLPRPSTPGAGARGDKPSAAKQDPSVSLLFDQPFGAVAGFLLGLLTLLVPLTGVIMDRPLQPGHQESEGPGLTPVAAAETPESRGPGRTAPDR